MQRILTTADVIAAIPGLIGFVPAESIVVVGITEHERGLQIGMTARHDIAGADQGFADYLAEVVYTHGLPRAAVIAITADDTAGDTSVRIMSDALMGYGIETDHRAVVARCDQPAPYRDLITGDTGISGDYRDSFASARRVMSGQYRAIRYAERLAECDAVASVGSKGDSYDNAMAEALNSLYKAELIRNRGPWTAINDVEIATAEYIDWFNNRRLHGEIGHVPPAELEAAYRATAREHSLTETK